MNKKFLCKAAPTRSSGLAIHTSGFHCDWLKEVTTKEVIAFWHFATSVSAMFACLALSL